MSLKADAEIERVQNILGAGGDAEVVPLLLPMRTYKILLEIGKERGISPADVLSNALVQYLKPKPEVTAPIAAPRQPSIQPDIVIKRRK